MQCIRLVRHQGTFWGASRARCGAASGSAFLFEASVSCADERPLLVLHWLGGQDHHDGRHRCVSHRFLQPGVCRMCVVQSLFSQLLGRWLILHPIGLSQASRPLAASRSLTRSTHRPSTPSPSTLPTVAGALLPSAKKTLRIVCCENPLSLRPVQKTVEAACPASALRHGCGRLAFLSSAA